MVYGIICREDYVKNNMTKIDTNTNARMKVDPRKFIQKVYTIASTDKIIIRLMKIDQSRLSDDGKYLLSDEKLLRICLDIKKNPHADAFKKIYKNKSMGAWIRELEILLKVGIEQDLFDSYASIEDKTKIDTDVPIDLIGILVEINVDIINNKLLNNPILMEQVGKLFNDLNLLNLFALFSKMLGNKCFMVNVATFLNFAYMFDFEKYQTLSFNEKLKLVMDFISLFGTSYRYSVVLAKENYNEIVSYRIHDTLPKGDKLNKTIKYYRSSYTREIITVPPIRQDYLTKDGKAIRVVLGDTANPINLTLGERTEACMRIGGHASALFDVCLLNKNGFHIRFEDPDTHKFISRVSGFRNGNTIFLNQLMNSIDNQYINADLKEILTIVARQLIDLTKND